MAKQLNFEYKGNEYSLETSGAQIICDSGVITLEGTSVTLTPKRR